MKKAQASLEFLLILGAAIGIAAFTIAIMVDIVFPVKKQIDTDSIDLLCSRKQLDACDGSKVELKDVEYGCRKDPTESRCVWNELHPT